MTKDEIQAIKARCEAVAKGRWHIEPGTKTRVRRLNALGENEFVGDMHSFEMANLELVLNAPADIPALLAEVEALTAERDAAVADLVPDCAICAFDRKTCGQEYLTIEERYRPIACDGWQWHGLEVENDFLEYTPSK